MKKLNDSEARKVNGGAWKCTKCGRKSSIWLQWLQHKNEYACYGGSAKFVLW